MVNAPGAGLAAPQIGVGLRVFTYYVDDELGHLINPSLDLSSEMQEGEEGCLSFPGIFVDTPRALRVVAKGFNQHGEPVVRAVWRAREQSCWLAAFSTRRITWTASCSSTGWTRHTASWL